jgi:hypothetical protein
LATLSTIGKLRRHVEPAPLQVEQQIAPVLRIAGATL